MGSKKKILFLIHALNPAGAQKVLVRMVNAMDRSKYDITIKTIYNRHDLKEELPSDVKLESLINYNSPLVDRIIGFLYRRILPPSLIADRLLGKDYDYIVAYLEGESTRLVSGSSLPKERKIAWVHVNLMKIFTSQGLYRTVEQHKKVYEKYGKIISVSNGVQQSITERFGITDNLSVIYNIIDQSQLCRLAAEKIEGMRKEKGISLLLVGNARKEKGYDRFLAVCKRLKDSGLDFHVTICGNGAELDSLIKLNKSLALEDVVEFKGQVKNPYPYMKKADVLICSSYSEGFSTVVIESIILDCPVLTTDCSGMQEILDNGKYGIIVSNSENGLYEGIKRIILNPEVLSEYRKRLPERKAFFSKEESLSQIDNLFK